jgi:FtsH-binding integral membrane protein
MTSPIGYILAIVLVGIMIWTARRIDRAWREVFPQEKPFAWGYFQALCFFPAGLLWFAVPFVATGASWLTWLAAVVYGIGGSFAGYTLIVRKKKWAWIAVVCAQLNLVAWLIDIYYGSSRWKEFR